LPVKINSVSSGLNTHVVHNYFFSTAIFLLTANVLLSRIHTLN
jgi:hypothetical protein